MPFAVLPIPEEVVILRIFSCPASKYSVVYESSSMSLYAIFAPVFDPLQIDDGFASVIVGAVVKDVKD